MEYKLNIGLLIIVSYILLLNEVNKMIFLLKYFVNIYLCINKYIFEFKRGFKW